jgi:phosphate transport system substrate-binding protein
MTSYSYSPVAAPRLHLIALALCLPLLAAACAERSAEGSAPAQQLVVTGSSTVAPLVADLARRFETQRPGVRVDIQTGGSSRGISDVRQGLAGIGMVSRALGESEADLAGHKLAMDGVALIVHASNPLRDLSSDQVIAVYAGRVRDWSEVGGSPGPITVVHKADGRSTQEVFLKHFAIDPADVQPSVVIGDNEQGVKSVAGNPGAIGYVSIGAAEASAESGVPVKLIALDGHAATSEEVASGDFPLVRELNLVTMGEVSPLASEFIAFARSSNAREFIEAHYFVALD